MTATPTGIVPEPYVVNAPRTTARNAQRKHPGPLTSRAA